MTNITLASLAEKHERRRTRMNLWFFRAKKRGNDKLTSKVNRYVDALIFGHMMVMSK